MGGLEHWDLDAKEESFSRSLSLSLSFSCLAINKSWYVTVKKGLEDICLVSLAPRRCIAAAGSIISSASCFFVLFFFFFPFLLTSSMDARLGPLLYLRIPPCSPPGPQPSVPKTDDLPTHPSTHPPTLSYPV